MEVRSDFLVIGTGIAGLSFALEAAKSGTVTIVTKKDKTEASTNYAQGGIASVFDPEDSFQAHVKDTLESGDGLCHEDIVQRVVQDGPARIRELIAMGVHFSHQSSNRENLDLGREGGHSRPVSQDQADNRDEPAKPPVPLLWTNLSLAIIEPRGQSAATMHHSRHRAHSSPPVHRHLNSQRYTRADRLPAPPNDALLVELPRPYPAR